MTKIQFNCNLHLNDTEIAWIAGLLEGEGYFGIDNRSINRYKKSNAPPSCYIRISMTDQDVIVKLANMLGKKNFQSGVPTKGGKTEYILQIADKKTLMYLLPRIQVHLGQRRKERVQECINLINDWKVWVESGGRSLSAAEGGKATAKKKSES